jgi:hypothetical protein
MGKRLDTEQAGYLVLCWLYPREGEAVNPHLERHFREYDEKISRDRVQREHLSGGNLLIGKM